MSKSNIPIPIPKNPNDFLDSFKSFVELVEILRKECPWDREQTNESIAPLMIEEVYETIDAIHQKNDSEFSKELGDLLLHIVMHAIMASERGAFNLNDVIKRIHTKMVSRHPHVFGDTEVTDSSEVMKNWEKLKRKEGKQSALDGVPLALPALLRAERIQHKASRVGFDWDNPEDVWAKVEEELGELKNELLANDSSENSTMEFGDLIFSLVNAGRFHNIVAEEALQKTNQKFIDRFQYIEMKAKEYGKEMKDMTLGEMDELWNQAKTNLNSEQKSNA